MRPCLDRRRRLPKTSSTPMPDPPAFARRFDNNPAGIDLLVAWVRNFAPERIVFEVDRSVSEGCPSALCWQGRLAGGRRQRSSGPRLCQGHWAIGQNGLHRRGASWPIFGERLSPLWSGRSRRRKSWSFATCAIGAAQLVPPCSPSRKIHRHGCPRRPPPKSARNIDKVIAFLERQNQGTRRPSGTGIVADSEAFKAKDEILQSIVGVGPQVARNPLGASTRIGPGQSTIHRRPGRNSLPSPTTAVHQGRIRHIRGGTRQSPHRSVPSRRRCHPLLPGHESLLCLPQGPRQGQQSRPHRGSARKILVVANAFVADWQPPTNSGQNSGERHLSW